MKLLSFNKEKKISQIHNILKLDKLLTQQLPLEGSKNLPTLKYMFHFTLLFSPIEVYHC